MRTSYSYSLYLSKISTLTRAHIPLSLISYFSLFQFQFFIGLIWFQALAVISFIILFSVRDKSKQFFILQTSLLSNILTLTFCFWKFSHLNVTEWLQIQSHYHTRFLLLFYLSLLYLLASSMSNNIISRHSTAKICLCK